MASARVFMAVLAAGASRRFGDEDKLTAPFRGKPLGQHATDNAPFDLIAPGCARVIVPALDHPCKKAWERAGFALAVNPQAGEGMGSSVALAARMAMEAECGFLLIALADMPLVPRAHFAALIEAGTARIKSLCSSDGRARMPPAIFGPDFPHPLASLGGDQGARKLLDATDALACPPEWLIDIDTPEALARHSRSA